MALTYIGTLIAGALAGVVADRLLGPAIDRWFRGRGVRRVQRRAQRAEFTGKDMVLGRHRLGISVLYGRIGYALEAEDVRLAFDRDPWVAPHRDSVHVRALAERGGFHDGRVVRLAALSIETFIDSAGNEQHRLRMATQPTGYFDMLATNIQLGPFDDVTAPLLRGPEGVVRTPLSNMMAIDLCAVTRDGCVPIFFRAEGMAAMERCWQVSCGETVQLPVDADTRGVPDLFHTAFRGLSEELGIEPTLVSDLGLTAVVATPEFSNIGLLMTAALDCDAAQLEELIAKKSLQARDNWEYASYSIVSLDDEENLASALCTWQGPWTKQAVASLVYAYAMWHDGRIDGLVRALQRHQAINLADPKARVAASEGT